MLNVIRKPAALGNWHSGRHSPISAIVLHLMDGTLAGTDNWFDTTPERRGGIASSAHYGIGKSGEVHQYVADGSTAYHAGRVLAPTWSLLQGGAKYYGVNPNEFTIGIEHEGHPGDVWTNAMIESSSTLIATLCTKYNVPIDREHIVGHHEIFAAKCCPGTNCPFDELIARAQQIAQVQQ